MTDSRDSRTLPLTVEQIEAWRDRMMTVFGDWHVEEVTPLEAEVEALCDMAIASLSESAPVWVSVKDRMPTKENATCVIGSDGVAWGVFPWKLDEAGKAAGWLDLYEGTLHTAKDVTHWMPVPELPSERDGG